MQQALPLLAATLALVPSLAVGGLVPAEPDGLLVVNSFGASQVSSTRSELRFAGAGQLTVEVLGLPVGWPHASTVEGTTTGYVAYQDASGVHFVFLDESWTARTLPTGHYLFEAFRQPTGYPVCWVYEVTTEARHGGLRATDRDHTSGCLY